MFWGATWPLRTGIFPPRPLPGGSSTRLSAPQPAPGLSCVRFRVGAAPGEGRGAPCPARPPASTLRCPPLPSAAGRCRASSHLHRPGAVLAAVLKDAARRQQAGSPRREHLSRTRRGRGGARTPRGRGGAGRESRAGMGLGFSEELLSQGPEAPAPLRPSGWSLSGRGWGAERWQRDC